MLSTVHRALQGPTPPCLPAASPINPGPILSDIDELITFMKIQQKPGTLKKRKCSVDNWPEGESKTVKGWKDDTSCFCLLQWISKITILRVTLFLLNGKEEKIILNWGEWFSLYPQEKFIPELFVHSRSSQNAPRMSQ